MSMNAVWHAASASLRRLARCERGAIAQLFAFVLVPTLVMGGAGLDFTRAYIAKVRLGGALDAAALAVGSTECSSIVKEECEAELNQVLIDYFNANYPDGAIGDPIDEDLQMTLNDDFDVVGVKGAAALPTTFLHFAGMDNLTVRVDIEVIREITGLEVVLALDNTGSMSGSKIAELRSASHDLINLVFGNFTDQPHPNLYVGIVPFQGVVNIGPENTQWALPPYATLLYKDRFQSGGGAAREISPSARRFLPNRAGRRSSSSTSGTSARDVRTWAG